jgi:dihydroorotate dehydrogenase (NAD+) catalytic subunit
VKVAPNPYDISTTADQITAVASHLTGVVSGNSIPAALIRYGNVQLGGMTGAWLKPVALRTAYEISTRITVPVIGCGGVENAQDVRDYLTAGCVAVQVGSANLRGPDAIVDVVTDLIQ